MNANVRGRHAGHWIAYVLLLLCALLFLYPFYIAVINSLIGWNDLPVMLPTRLLWENYRYVFTTETIDFWAFTLNSAIICAIMVVTATLSSGMVGYAFARLQAPGRSFLFGVLLSTMMVPAIVTQIPTYLLLFNYKMLDTFVPWLIWGIGGGVGGGAAYFVFFYRQFFSGIPKELEEAARMDGCSFFRTYWNIFLPLSLPVVATVAILNFQWNWSDSISGFLFMKQHHYPLAVALSVLGYVQEGASNVIIQPVSIAAGLLATIPVFVVFFLGQRYLVEGIATTGVKG